MTSKRNIERRLDQIDHDSKGENELFPLVAAAYDAERGVYLDTDGTVKKHVKEPVVIIPTDEQIETRLTQERDRQ